MSRVHFAMLVPVALVGCLCACGTSDSGKAASSTPAAAHSSAATSASSTAAAGSTSASAAGGGPAAAALPALVVQATDVAGYTGDGSAASEAKGDSDSAQTAQCVGEPDPNQYFLAEYESDEFSNDSLSIDSDITSYTSAQAITIDRALIAKPDQLAACFKQSGEASGSLPSGATVDSVKVVPAPAGTPSNALGDVQVQLTIPDQGKVYVDEVLIVGKYVDEGLTFSSDQPIPTAVLQSLTTTIANRIAGK
jgi:hypothetical protein